MPEVELRSTAESQLWPATSGTTLTEACKAGLAGVKPTRMFWLETMALPVVEVKISEVGE